MDSGLLLGVDRGSIFDHRFWDAVSRHRLRDQCRLILLSDEVHLLYHKVKVLLEEPMRESVKIDNGGEAMGDLFVQFFHHRVPLLDLLLILVHLFFVLVAQISPQIWLGYLN